MITVVKELVGDRPAGDDAGDVADRADRASGGPRRSASRPGLGEGSTDANIPMSLSIPAITIGGGGTRPRTRTRSPSRSTRPILERDAARVLLAIALTQK